MRRFRYRLETLQKMAERAHRSATVALATSRRALQVKQDLALTIARAKADTGRSTPAPGKKVAACELQRVQKHVEKLSGDLARARAIVKAHESVVQKRQQQRTETERQVKKHELLRSKRYLSWLADAKRTEQRQLDQVAGQIASRARRAELENLADTEGKVVRRVALTDSGSAS